VGVSWHLNGIGTDPDSSSMVLFFVAFSMNWYSSGATLQELIAVGVVTLFVFVMIAVSIMRTKERHHWLPMALELLSDLAYIFKRVIGIARARRDDDISLTRIGPSEANAVADDPMGSTAHLTAVPTRPTASGYSLHPSNDGHSTLPSQYPCPSSRHLVGTWTAPEVQPTGEARYEPEPDHPSLAVNEPLHSIPTKAVIPSDHNQQTLAVVTDSGAAISEPDPLRAEERDGLAHIVKNPQEFNVPRVRESTTSPPIIVARGATGEAFYPAPQAAKRTRRNLEEPRDK